MAAKWKYTVLFTFCPTIYWVQSRHFAKFYFYYNPTSSRAIFYSGNRKLTKRENCNLFNGQMKAT